MTMSTKERKSLIREARSLASLEVSVLPPLKHLQQAAERELRAEETGIVS